MKKSQVLGRILSKKEQKEIRGGYEDPGGGPQCKSATTNCSFVTIEGNVLQGKCGDTITPPMQSTQCGCKVGENVQPATECNQTQ